MHALVVPVVPLTVGLLLSSAVKQAFLAIYNFFFGVKEPANGVFSTALVIRDSGALMVRETYDTSLVLFRNILDGVLVPFIYVSKALTLILHPVVDVVVVIMKALILVIRHASELVLHVVETTSPLLSSIFSTIQTIATDTSASVSSWAIWIYQGTTNTFYYTLLYIVGFYILAQIILLFTKRLVKKIK
jgi:hypothetical protein